MSWCNRLEHGHVYTHSSEFWNWSLDELAKFDAPAMVNYILYSTKLTKLSYIGHSQGNAQMFLALSLDPSLSKKISLFG